MAQESVSSPFSDQHLDSYRHQDALSRDVAEQHLTLGSHVCQVAEGIQIEVDEGVFSPLMFDGWKVFTARLAQEDFQGKDFLEIGGGAGPTGLYLAKKAGLRSVTLTDINPVAVTNMKKNAARLELDECRVDVLESDVFDGLPAEARYDAIYWNHPFGPEREDYQHANTIELGLFDPGYRALRRYVAGAKLRLREGGRVFLGFGGEQFGDEDLLRQYAKENGYRAQVLTREMGLEGGGEVEFVLYELVVLPD